MDRKSPESKRLRNNKRKTHTSSHVSRKVPKTNIKIHSSSVKHFNQISQSNTTLVDSDVRDPNQRSPLLLDFKKWGRDDGFNSLPSLSQINALREGKTCEFVKNIQTSPYTYTAGVCLFDSAMFCLLTSHYFEMIIPYIDGPRLYFIICMCTNITNN